MYYLLFSRFWFQNWIRTRKVTEPTDNRAPDAVIVSRDRFVTAYNESGRSHKKRNISLGMQIIKPVLSALPGKHIPLVIFVPLPGQHISLAICVPLPGKHTSLVTSVALTGKHTSLIRDMCSPTQGTYIPSDLCFPTRKTHIHSEMCFPFLGNTYL